MRFTDNFLVYDFIEGTCLMQYLFILLTRHLLMNRLYTRVCKMIV